jgi:tetratricopeptide (TPR) repeat protein/polyhydroxyalkanoate synthesis regulator phasin/energy-coupling factor transporter ATP-binding protein EcfA2
VDLEETKKAVLRLSPDGLCLGGLLDLKGVASDVVDKVVGAFLLGLFGVSPIGSLVGAGIAEVASKLLRWLLEKGGIAKNETIECLRNIVNAAKEASQYIDDESLSGIVEEVASKWGWDIDTFRRFVKTAAGKTITEDEVKKMIEEALEKIKEELGKVRERVSGQLAGVEVFFIDDVEDGLVYPTVRLVNGELMVLGGYGYHEVVRTGSFGALASEVGRRLGAGSLVVLTGPKGVGKSTLASVTIWNLLRSGEVGMVLRIKELPEGEVVERFRSFIENFLVRDWEYFGNLVILYDPTGVYGQVGGVEAPSKLETTVRNVFGAVVKAQENVRSILGREPSARVGVLIIIPTDLYNALSNDVKGKLESYRLDALLNDVEFLAKLIMEYTRTSDKPSGCKISDEELSKLAGKVAGFDSGHALIARLIGEELARSNCDVGRIEELINNAKGKAEAFIILHINKLFKVHENPDTAKALVEIFALRKPFINLVRPGDPILTPGIVGLIGEKKGASLLQSAEGGELRGWLAIRQHDLIEEAIKKLLKCIVSEGEECKKFDDVLLKPWKEAHVPRIRSRTDAVKYFARKYGKRFIKKLRKHKSCWKRAAFIIGHALTGRPIVPRPEDLPSDIVGSLGDALGKCEEIDNYLLVGGKIPPLIMNLTKDHAYALTEAFVDKYDEAVAEVNRILNIARDRGSIYVAEGLYGLGLALIIAKAVESGKPIEPGDANTALHIASSAIQSVAVPDLIKSVLGALEPLRGKAPLGYLELLVSVSDMENLDHDTVEHIFKELNEILGSYGDVVRGYAWSLVYAIHAYADLLRMHLTYFSYGEIENMVSRVADLLNELGKFKTSLGVIAWAHALAPALDSENVRVLMEKALRIDVVDKASEVLDELSGLRGLIQELMRDEEFMGYVESWFVKADEEAVKKVILGASSLLKHELARYRLNNDELDEAARLFNEAAEEDREIGSYENYLVDRGLALRVEAIKGLLVGDELVKKFQQLYEETFNVEHLMPTARYLSNASSTLGGYLVSLALTGDYKTISKLLEEHLWVLDANKQVSVLTRLMLNALLGHRVELSGELEGKLSVNPEELINAFETDVDSEFLPALRIALGIAKPEDEIKPCVEFIDEGCIDSILAVKGNSAAVKQLREGLIDAFRKRISKGEVVDLLMELGFDTNALIGEFGKLVYGLDGKSLVQLIAPRDSMAQLALILYALINGDEELAKVHALYGAVGFYVKLPIRLLLDVYKACEKGCDLGNEGLRQAITKLFLYHI